MKRFNVKFMLMEGLVLAAIGLIGGIISSLFVEPEHKSFMVMAIGGFIFFCITFIYCLCGNSIMGKFAKKTMEENSEKANLSDYSTFVTDGPFTIGGIVRIDENTGRIAYVSYQNPFKFQLVSAKDITRIKSSYMKSPLGGTSLVYFEFYYKNKKLRIPTFTASNVYSLQSREVLEGISKADAYCEILTNAQKAVV